MSTIAVNRRGYVNTNANTEKVSFTERLKKYFEENAATISAGLLMMNGSTSPYTLYRMMK